MKKRVPLVVVIVVALATQTMAGGTFDCEKAPGFPSDRRKDKSELVVGTFNVEWLFDGVSGPSSCPWKDAEAADKHLEEVASFMKSLSPSPDVVFLEEVQDCTMLRRLISALGDDSYAPYMIKGTDSSTMQNTGMITRVDPIVNLYRSDARWDYPLDGNQCGYKGEDGSTGVSKHLFTQIAVNGKKIGLAVVHFLAFPTQSDRCAKREAQASVIRDALDKFLAANIDVIVAGDFNDYSRDVPDSADDIPTSRTVSIIKNGLIAKSSAAGTNSTAQAATVLMEVSELIPQKDRYSSFYSGKYYSQIDHMLISSGLSASISSATIDHGFSPGVVSDHWPLLTVIKT